jgi:two-component system, OmpR family, heavy metal sensor histidine kinase CusS
MRSTRLTHFILYLASVGLVVGVFAVLAGLQWSAISGWVLLTVLLLAVLLGLGLAFRVNRSVRLLGDRLSALDRFKGSEKIDIPESDPGYRRLLKELNRLRETTGNSRDELQLFAAKVAHELRGPITLLQLQVEHVAPSLDPEVRETLQTQIARLAGFVETALLVAKARRGELPIHKERVNLERFISDLIEPQELRAQMHRRTLTYRIGATGEHVLDPKIVGLIFNNLFSNAFDHGDGEIRIGLFLHRGRPTVTVANRARKRSDRDEMSGTGMGLEIVRVMSTSHGGLAVKTRRFRLAFGARLTFIGSSG